MIKNHPETIFSHAEELDGERVTAGPVPPDRIPLAMRIPERKPISPRKTERSQERSTDSRSTSSPR